MSANFRCAVLCNNYGIWGCNATCVVPNDCMYYEKSIVTAIAVRLDKQFWIGYKSIFGTSQYAAKSIFGDCIPCPLAQYNIYVFYTWYMIIYTLCNETPSACVVISVSTSMWDDTIILMYWQKCLFDTVHCGLPGGENVCVAFLLLNYIWALELMNFVLTFSGSKGTRALLSSCLLQMLCVWEVSGWSTLCYRLQPKSVLWTGLSQVSTCNS